MAQKSAGKSPAKSGKTAKRGSGSGSKSKASKAAKPAKGKRGGWFGRSLWFVTRWSLVLAVWGGVAGGAALLYFAHDLPDIRDQMVLERRKSRFSVDERRQRARGGAATNNKLDLIATCPDRQGVRDHSP